MVSFLKYPVAAPGDRRGEAERNSFAFAKGEGQGRMPGPGGHRPGETSPGGAPKKRSIFLSIFSMFTFLSLVLILSPPQVRGEGTGGIESSDESGPADPREELESLNQKLLLIEQELEVYRERARQWESLRAGLGVQERSLLEEREASGGRIDLLERRLSEEVQERQRLERERDLLRGNLVSPGIGHLRQGRTIRGLTWAGLFVGSFLATAASYSRQEDLRRSLDRNAFNPLERPRAQARYDQAYNRTAILGGITVGIYGMGVLDALTGDGEPPTLAGGPAGRGRPHMAGWGVGPGLRFTVHF